MGKAKVRAKGSQKPKAKKKVRTSAAPARPARGKAPNLAGALVPPPVEGSEAEYERWLPAARALRAADVQVMRADGSIAFHNVDDGVSALLARSADLRAQLPRVDATRIAALPGLARAVIFAAAQIEDPRSDGTVRKQLARLFQLRDNLLSAAESAAKNGVLPAQRVAEIRAGHGNIDAAQDCVDLAALFRKNATALAGKTPITAELLQEAAALGDALLGVLRPGRSKPKPKSDADRAAADLRDRMWTLLVDGWQGEHGAERAGAYLWGRDVASHVPALLAFHGGRRRKAAPAAASPAAPATT